MRTNIGPFVVNTNGYDVVAELEKSGDKYGTAKYIREKKQECEEKARQYLTEHPKTLYCMMIGYPYELEHEDFTPDNDYSQLVAYTDEEIQRIKELFVELWNKDVVDPASYVKSFEDIPDKEFDLADFEGINDELDKLIWERAAAHEFAVAEIDLLHPVHAYRFRTWEYDKRKDEMRRHKASHRVILSDDEYIYLLTEQLFDRYFSFNRLLLYNAPLAQKICEATDGDYMFNSFSPYLILMDEVVEDMEQIEGHDPVDGELCMYNENGHTYHAHLIIERDKMEVYWQDLPEDDFNMERLTEGHARDIDAQAVLKLFEAEDYVDLLERIQKRFNSHAAYDELLAYLHENGIHEIG